MRRIDIQLAISGLQPWERLDVTLFDLGADINIELPALDAILTEAERQQLADELADHFGPDEPRVALSGWDDHPEQSPS